MKRFVKFIHIPFLKYLLVIASSECHLEVVKKFINYNANIETKDWIDSIYQIFSCIKN